jgi:hypothetical protein
MIDARKLKLTHLRPRQTVTTTERPDGIYSDVSPEVRWSEEEWETGLVDAVLRTQPGRPSRRWWKRS